MAKIKDIAPITERVFEELDKRRSVYLGYGRSSMPLRCVDGNGWIYFADTFKKDGQKVWGIFRAKRGFPCSHEPIEDCPTFTYEIQANRYLKKLHDEFELCGYGHEDLTNYLRKIHSLPFF